MNEVDTLARILLDYLRIGQPLVKSDAIVGMGALDVRVAEWATELLIDGYGNYLVFVGGYGRLAEHHGQKQSEAERFCEVALALGIPPSKIHLDKRGSNVEENIANVIATLKREKLHPKSLLIVTRSFMERRVYTAFAERWPDKDVRITVTSPPLTFDEQDEEGITKDLFVNLLVGDLQRVSLHPKHGLRQLPDDVRLAYERLIDLGYTKQMLPTKKTTPRKKTPAK